jgi:hypothetical protein
MITFKLWAIVLITAGILGLAYGGFSYTRKEHTATLGSVELAVKDQETVNIPVWAGVAAIVAGAGFLLVGSKKK